MPDNNRCDNFREECRFCSLPEPWRVILRTPRFRVLVGLGPPVVGYCVLITEKHVDCYAALQSSQTDEFLFVVRAIQTAQRRVFGASLLFEHGRNGGCLPYGHDDDLCYHAHLHVLPAALDLVQAVQADYGIENVDDWDALRAVTDGGAIPYLLVQNGLQLACVIDPQKLPGRYLRTKIAQILNLDPAYADWQAFPRYDMVRQGVAALRDTLSQTWYSLTAANEDAC